jgi:2-polyprenyl-6-hydroxyphenyl methylase/3-demethylubiquinone-9 3-methyltransferase
MMDQVWDKFGCDNRKPDWDKIGKFYQHPVWILNGLFIEQHDLSMQHRHAISDWIKLNQKKYSIQKIVDYGGGFGTLAKLIAKKDSRLQIDILEPYPLDFAKKNVINSPNVRFVNSLNSSYDCLISTDVLEHVSNPLRTFSEMISCVRLQGFLVIANNFFPVIKCHLPNTFHLRFTFRVFAHILGLRYIRPCYGSHASIYQKISDKPPNWRKIRLIEKISIFLFPFLKLMHLIYKNIKAIFK